MLTGRHGKYKVTFDRDGRKTSERIVDPPVQAVDAGFAQFGRPYQAATMIGAEDRLCHKEEPCFDAEIIIQRGHDLIGTAAPGQRSSMLGRRAE